MTKTPFIVAEIGANHLGSFEHAIRLIDAASQAGADAVKLQCFTPEGMVADDTYVIQDGPWAGRKLIDLYREAQTPLDWFKPLFDYARRLGIEAFSSVFDAEGVDFLETLNCPRYKISSFELIDLELIRKAASTGKPLILSTGMAHTGEMFEAVQSARKGGCRDITLLKCTSAYPADPSDANLLELDTWHQCNRESLWGLDDLPELNKVEHFGLSDHTLGCGVACAATYPYISMLEKHLTLSRADGGPDAGFSMEPHEFAIMVIEVRRAASAIMKHVNETSPRFESEKSSLALRRSLYFAQDLEKGTVLTQCHLRTARPALGLHPHHLESLYGRTLTTSIKKGDPVTWATLTECHAA